MNPFQYFFLICDKIDSLISGQALSLAEWKRQYRAGEKPSEASLRRQLKQHQGRTVPVDEGGDQNAPQQAIKNLGTALLERLRRHRQVPSAQRERTA